MRGPANRTPRYSNEDKNLIAEQPGRVVFLSGLVLAITLGLIFRGLTAPEKVRAQVQAAAKSINKDLDVQFETARVSLRRGLIPRFAVVINNVRMVSSNPCWMTPTLQADEIRLPVSFWALVQGENPVTEVGAGQVHVLLQSGFKECQNQPASTPESEPKSGFTPHVVLKNKKNVTIATTSPQPQVRAISIDELSVEGPGMNQPLELSDFSVRMTSSSPKVIAVSAKTHLIRDDSVGDYLSHATIAAEYTEFPKPRVVGRVNGNWREGSYQLNADYLVKEEQLGADVDLRHVPLSQVAHVLKRFNWLSSDVNARQVWVSMNARLAGAAHKLQNAELDLKNFRLEGDIGEVLVPALRVTSFEPFHHAPFIIDIQKLNIGKWLELLNRAPPSSTVAHLGSFTGTATISSENDAVVTGVQRGLEFIFANKGQREIQTLKEVALAANLKGDRWNLTASKVVLDQNPIDGNLQVVADRDWRTFDMTAHVAALHLSPNVVRLMTAGGRVGSLGAELHGKWRAGQWNEWKGLLTADDIAVEGVAAEKSRVQLDSNDGLIVAQAQVQGVTVATGSPTFQTLKDVIEPAWMKDGKLALKTLNSQIQFHTFKNLAWKNLRAQMSEGGQLASDGHWDEVGVLSGQVQTVAGKVQRHWTVSGRRDHPVFTPEAGKKKRP